jgi:hypothetical protein|tara:strand:- start:527 stop:1609 length:1083 start_codon:yes stop_codon:yes gene_type:complete
MSGSGGSVSDVPMQKTVDGQPHQLAYITPGEAQTLVDQGGKPTMTSEGIMAYPPFGQPGASPGTTSSGGFSGGRGGGADRQQYSAQQTTKKSTPKTTSPKVNYSSKDDTREQYGVQRTITPKTKAVDPQKVREGSQQAPYQVVGGQKVAVGDPRAAELSNVVDTRSPFEKGVSNVIDFYKKGGFLGNFLSGISSNIQKKAMTFSLNKKINDLSSKADFHPGAYGYKIQDMQKDLAAIEAGTFGQNDYTKKYGSGDATNPLDASFNPNTLTDSERDNLSNLFQSETIFATAKVNPVESMAAKWYKNLGNVKNNFAYQSAYASAKAKQQGILGSPSPMRYHAVSESPFYDWLKTNSLDKGIL